MIERDEELAALFARERRAHPSSAAAKARVLARLEGPVGPGGGGGSPAAPASVPPPPVSRVYVKLGVIVACLVGAGGVLYSQVPASEIASAATPRVPATSSVHTPRPILLAAGSSKAVDAVEPPTPVAPHVESAPVVAPTTEAACAICDEQRILDIGRRGLRDRHYDDALSAVKEHEARFPQGQLAEERESLRVHLLTAMGKTQEADDAKRAFRRAFPKSPLLDSVEHAGDTQ